MQLRRYLANKSYGHAYGVSPRQWNDMHLEAMKSGKFQMENNNTPDDLLKDNIPTTRLPEIRGAKSPVSKS